MNPYESKLQPAHEDIRKHFIYLGKSSLLRLKTRGDDTDDTHPPEARPPKKRWDGHYSSSKCLSRFVQKISPNMNCGGTFEVDCPFNIPWSPYQLVGLPCLPYLCRWEITVSLLVTLGSTFTVRCGKSHHLNIFRMAFPVAFPHLTISQQRTMLPSIALERTRNPGAHMRPASVPSWDWIY